MLRTDLPDDTEINGYTPCVLALVNIDTYFCKGNTYIPAWQISNATWYRLHSEQYVGWYPLEFIDLSHIEKPCDEEAEDKFFNEIFGVNETT